MSNDQAGAINYILSSEDRRKLEEALRESIDNFPANTRHRAALSLLAGLPKWQALSDAQIQTDDELRFVQRVLESNAPEQDRERARNMIVAMRTAHRAAMKDQVAAQRAALEKAFK